MKPAVNFMLLGLLLPALSGVAFAASDDVNWSSPKVVVYTKASPQNFGRATDRSQTIVEDVYNFSRGYALPVADPAGTLTAVTVDENVKESLDALLSKNTVITIKDVELSLVHVDAMGEPLTTPYYSYREKERGIFIGFSLERPNDAIYKLIAAAYASEPTTREIVADHYRHAYVLRIFHVNNLYSKNDPPTFIDVLLGATLLGEKKQVLLGIHDGLDYLSPLANFYRSTQDYSVLTDSFNDTLAR